MLSFLKNGMANCEKESLKVDRDGKCLLINEYFKKIEKNSIIERLLSMPMGLDSVPSTGIREGGHTYTQ